MLKKFRGGGICPKCPPWLRLWLYPYKSNSNGYRSTSPWHLSQYVSIWAWDVYGTQQELNFWRKHIYNVQYTMNNCTIVEPALALERAVGPRPIQHCLNLLYYFGRARVKTLVKFHQRFNLWWNFTTIVVLTCLFWDKRPTLVQRRWKRMLTFSKNGEDDETE